tara:strand:+ start:311 stop:655 length:345 start_codon:yes stop_codon:yes gene_type:complete
MHKLFQNIYNTLIIFTSFFFINISTAKPDEVLIGLNAYAKHYCVCFFISEMKSDYCDEAYDHIISASISDDELLSQIKFLGYKKDENKKEISIEYEEYNVVSIFTKETGCYFKK